MTIVRKCMTIMSIIITEEDLCKKHAKKCAKICQFSSLPSKCFQAANDPNSKNDSKPHISPYNYNTCTGFRVHKNIWGRRWLSSALMYTDTISQSPSQISSHSIIIMGRLINYYRVFSSNKQNQNWKIDTSLGAIGAQFCFLLYRPVCRNQWTC